MFGSLILLKGSSEWPSCLAGAGDDRRRKREFSRGRRRFSKRLDDVPQLLKLRNLD